MQYQLQYSLTVVVILLSTSMCLETVLLKRVLVGCFGGYIRHSVIVLSLSMIRQIIFDH